MGSPASDLIVQRLTDWKWRVNNLYTVVDKDGNEVPFVMNEQQLHLFDNMHYLNVILKARQLGFSTFIMIFMLDACLWGINVSCALVDVTMADAKSKLEKARLAYSRLPDWIRPLVPAITTSNTRELSFDNGCGITAGVSHRGGTNQYLHISEFGRICAHYPERAREIITGALNTLAAGQVAFIESTAEGEEGRFFDICQTAQSKQRMKEKMTPLDWKFFFYPWYDEPRYQIDAEGVVIPGTMQAYFERLAEREGIKLTPEQQAWYVKTAEDQQDDMKREYPATPEEAFEASVEGAIFGPWLAVVEETGRIGHFPALPDIPVHSFWDIGKRDATAVCFVQILVGGRVRVVGYYELFMAKLQEHAKNIRQLYKDRGWEREGAEDWWPHDGRVGEWTSTDRTRVESGIKEGLNIRIAPNVSLQDGINAGRATFALCEIDAKGCADGLKRLRNYRWEWNEARGAFNLGTPRPHDPNNHGCDAWRYMGLSWREVIPSFEEQVDPLNQLIAPRTMDEAINEALEGTE